MKNKTMRRIFVLLILGFLVYLAWPSEKSAPAKGEGQVATCSPIQSQLPKKENSTSEISSEQKPSGLNLPDYHQAFETSVEMPLGKMVVTTFAQNGIPIQGMRLRKLIHRDGTVKLLEDSYRPIPEIEVPISGLENQLFIYVERNKNFGTLAYGLENKIVRFSDQEIIRETLPRRERKPANLHHKGLGG